MIAIQLLNLDQTTTSNLDQMLQNLDQTVVNTFLNINSSNTNNIKKLLVVNFKSQSHINQVY